MILLSFFCFHQSATTMIQQKLEGVQAGPKPGVFQFGVVEFGFLVPSLGPGPGPGGGGAGLGSFLQLKMERRKDAVRRPLIFPKKQWMLLCSLRGYGNTSKR